MGVEFNGDGEVTRIRFTVHGDPVPQGSKRHVGKGIMVESSKALMPWRDSVIAAIVELDGIPAPLRGPFHVELCFRFRRPKSHFGTGRNAMRLKDSAPDYMSSRPDADKLARAVLDAMEQSGLIADDGQVAVLVVDKRYSPMPGLIANVRPLA